MSAEMDQALDVRSPEGDWSPELRVGPGGRLILETYTEEFGSGDEQYVEDQLAKLKSKAPVPIPNTSLGWLNTAKKLTYEEKELRKLWDFDPEHPVRMGTLVWDGRLKGWVRAAM
jgi:hypothetical protein